MLKLLLTICLLSQIVKAQSFSSIPSWQEEFNYSGPPDSTIWSFDLGGEGWGNRELQNYTSRFENIKVDDGMLQITARKEASGKNEYSSARLVTKNKKDFLYGRIEIRAKLPKGIGTWPAIWMLSSDQNYGNSYWPDNGELDIMEHVGFDQNVIHANIHSKAFNHSIGTNKGDKVRLRDATDAFHIYSMDWKPNKISFAIDGVTYFEFAKEANYTWKEWPFDKPFHLLLNIAIGGSWGGQKGVDKYIFPQTMSVDYVRYYSLVN